MAGWIKLHRQILKWGWYSDAITCRVFIHLLLSATHKPITLAGVPLLPGQLVTGRKKLSTELGISQQRIRTALDRLESGLEIGRKSTNKYTVITIIKWDIYQGEDEDDQPTINQQSTNNQPPYKKLKNEKKVKRGGFTPPKREIVTSFFVQNGSTDFEGEKYFDYFTSNGWKVGGKTPMKDWEAAARNWIRRNNPSPGSQGLDERSQDEVNRIREEERKRLAALRGNTP